MRLVDPATRPRGSRRRRLRLAPSGACGCCAQPSPKPFFVVSTRNALVLQTLVVLVDLAPDELAAVHGRHLSRGAAAHEWVKHDVAGAATGEDTRDRKSTRLNSSHQLISYAVFC